jgi:hypothetical protein
MGNARSFLVPFKYSDKVAYVVEFSHRKIRLLAKNQILTEGGIDFSSKYEILNEEDENLMQVSDYPILVVDSPYEYEDLWDEDDKCFGLQTIQHSDVLYIFSENHPIMTLKRYANTDWRIEELELKDGPFMAMNTSDIIISASNVEGEITIEADGDVFCDTDIGRLLRLRNYDDDTEVWVAGKRFEVNDMCVSDNKFYKALNGAEAGSVKPVHGVGIKSDGGIRWKFIHDGIGIVKIKEFVDKKNVKAEVLKRLPDTIKDGTIYWELGLLHNGTKRPKSGAFFRNRFCFLVNTDTGPNVCMSYIGDYNNFSDLDVGEVTAETAITVPVLNTEFNDGKWLYAGKSLFVGTGSSEFYIDVMTTSSAMASDNVKISQISNIGSKAIMPVSIGSHVFFVDRYGLSLRDLMYDYYSEGYNQIDISILGKHLFTSRIVGISYQEVPDKILWCLVGDGNLVAMTFSQDQEVAAFSRHDFSGKVESIAVIPNLEDCRDEVWIAVNRIINFRNIRTIEKIEHGIPQIFPDSIYANNNLKEQNELQKEYVKYHALYLDGFVLFERKLGDDATEITGLNHLEGKTVGVFADGGVVYNQTVIGGKISIDKNMTRVIVGLPIVSQYIPQSVFIDNQYGSGLGQRQRINHVMLMLYMSGGGKIGQDQSCLKEICYRSSDAKLNKAEKLFSGKKEILFNGTTNLTEVGASIMIENDTPLPMNILAIVPYIDVN